LDAINVRRMRPEASEQEIDEDVARKMDTGEFDQITRRAP
jgi:hypothetical protein